MKCEALRDESDQLNLTGSPLKDSCNFEQLSESFSEEFSKQNAWKDEEEKYHTISLSDAQYVSFFLLLNFKDKYKLHRLHIDFIFVIQGLF